MSSRRDFIIDAALLTAGTLIPRTSLFSYSIPKKKKIIIIGAGFAGLSAAYSLYQRNIDFEIIESKNEVGGRVFSHVLDENAMYGKGEWFDLFPKLNASHIHTHFAGEHLSEYWQGFMEGALETGKEAAAKI